MGPRVGVLALQGAFREHARALASLGAVVEEVRLPQHLAALDGLVIPGGESTAIAKLMDRYALETPLRSFVAEKPVLATCAGLILLAREVRGALPGQPLLGVLDATVERNAYGRQVDSFEAPVNLFPPLAPEPGIDFPGVFIRAPRILRVGPQVAVVARLGTEPVGLLQEQLLALTFHPELTPDLRIHSFFLDLLKGKKADRLRRELSLTEV